MAENIQQVSLEPQQPTGPSIPQVDLSNSSPDLPSSDTIEDRGNKASIGIGPIVKKNKDEIIQDLQTGAEKALRRQAAAVLDGQSAKDRHDKLVQLTSLMSGGVNVPDEAFRRLLDPSLAKPTDPDSVIERSYGHAVTASLGDSAITTESPAWKNANKYLPGFVNNIKEKASLLSSQQAFLNTQLQNVNDTLSKDSWWNFGKEFALQNIPGVSLLHESNIQDLGGQGYGLLGNSLKAFADHVFGLPYDQFQQQVTQALAPLNPYQQREVLTALNGQSTSDRVLNNLGTLGNIAMVPGLPTAGKLGVNALRDIGTVESAAKSVVTAGTLKNVTKADLANAAGDVKTAAVDTASKILTGQATGKTEIDPIQIARQNLTSNLQIDNTKIEANPGRFGNELANRMIERNQQVTDNIFNQLNTDLKVDRIPEFKANPEVQKMVLEDIRKDYVGMPNSLLDSRWSWDSLTNSTWIEHILGHYDGTLFKTPEQAMNFARDNGLIIAKHSPAGEALQKRIADIEENLKSPPAMDADVNELNRHYGLEEELNQKKQALLMMSQNLDGYTIAQKGLGFYISRWMPLRETSPVMRDAMAQTQFDKVFQAGWFKTALGWLRTPEEVLSRAENDQRHIATFGPNKLLSAFRDASQKIEKLPGKYWDDWNRTVEAGRHLYDEQGRVGKFFNNPGELEDFYQTTFHRLPEKPEIEAYFEFKRNVELDRVMRELQEFRYRARVGAEQHRLTIVDKNGNKVQSQFFDGIKQREIPGGDDTVAIMNPSGGKTYSHWGNVPAKIRDEATAAIQKGEKGVIRIYNPEELPLSGFGGISNNQRVRYIVTDMSESKPLDFNHVERRGGGHFMWDHDYYIKQAKIFKEVVGKTVRHWYQGDKTVMPIAIQKMGQDITGHMNEVRKLIKANDLEAAEAYNNQHLHIPWDEHLGWYKQGHLDADHDLHLVPRNKSILDLDNRLPEQFKYTDKTGETRSSFRDGTRAGSDARQYQIEFVNPRDVDTMYTLNDVGGRHNPLYQYEPAKMVDPIATMNRALNRVSNGMYLDDMKLYSVEHWLREAGPLLDINAGEDRSNPFGTFMNAKWKTGADPIRTSNLDSAKAKIQHFIGNAPSKLDTYMQAVQQKMVDSIYGKVGGDKINKVLDWVDLTKTRDPLAFMRTATFHLKLGMFNVPQFFTQLMTSANILGIAGYRPFAGGTMATYFHYLTGFNKTPELLAHMDRMATQMHFPGAYRFKPGEFTEAYNFIKESGFEILGHEVGMLDTPFNAKVIQNGMNRFLDWGETPFRLGAQNTRLSAMYTAYLEHRAENPLGPLSRGDKEDILSRASLLDHNMNRSANSALHTGIMAPAAQFAAYSLRLTELMTGKRLTTAEKWRLFGTSSILYGVPLGGVGLFGWPAGDVLRRKFEESGYVPGANMPSTIFNEGLPATLYATITGAIKNGKDGTQWDLQKDMRKGDYLNFSKWGPEAYQIGEKMLNGEASMWDIGGGASFGTMRDMWRLSSPLRYWASTFVTDHDNAYPLTADDVLQAGRVWSGFNHYWQAKAGFETGRWLSMNDVYLEDVSKFNSLLQGVTGLSPVNVSDITLTRTSIQQREDGYKQGEQAALLQIRRGLQALQNNDTQQADKYFTAAKAITRIMPLELQNSVAKRALTENEPLVDRLKQDYFVKKAPLDVQEKFYNFYQGWQELMQERRGK